MRTWYAEPSPQVAEVSNFGPMVQQAAMSNVKGRLRRPLWQIANQPQENGRDDV